MGTDRKAASTRDPGPVPESDGAAPTVPEEPPSQLALVAVRHERLPEPLVLPLGEGATIGRGIDNTLVLYDPERHISRIHALIHRVGEAYAMRALGRFVPVFVNAQPTLVGVDAWLSRGDIIEIGAYRIEIL